MRNDFFAVPLEACCPCGAGMGTWSALTLAALARVVTPGSKVHGQRNEAKACVCQGGCAVGPALAVRAATAARRLPSVLAPGGCRTTHFVRFALCVQTGAASMMNEGALCAPPAHHCASRHPQCKRRAHSAPALEVAAVVSPPHPLCRGRCCPVRATSAVAVEQVRGPGARPRACVYMLAGAVRAQRPQGEKRVPPRWPPGLCHGGVGAADRRSGARAGQRLPRHGQGSRMPWRASQRRPRPHGPSYSPCPPQSTENLCHSRSAYCPPHDSV